MSNIISGVVGDSLYVAGGKEAADATLDTAERFNEDTQRWEEEEARLSCPRSGHSTATVKVEWCQHLEMPKEEEQDDDEEDLAEVKDLETVKDEDGDLDAFVFSRSGLKDVNG